MQRRDLLTFVLHQSHLTLPSPPPYLPAPEKLLLFVLMFCLLLLQFILCLLLPLTSLLHQYLAFLWITKQKAIWSLFPFQQLRYPTRRPQKKIIFTIFLLHRSARSLKSVSVLLPLILGPFGPPKKRVNSDILNILNIFRPPITLPK